jgi:hypothetical protein
VCDIDVDMCDEDIKVRGTDEYNGSQMCSNNTTSCTCHDCFTLARLFGKTYSMSRIANPANSVLDLGSGCGVVFIV